MRKEHAELVWILGRWINAKEVEKILTKKKSGKPLSLREVYVARAASGSDIILKNLSDKILPDKLDMTSGGEKVQGVVYLPMPDKDSNE